MFLGNFITQEDDGADILQRLRVYDRWDKALSRVFVNDQAAIFFRNRAEKSCFCIADCFEFACSPFKAKYIRYAGIERRAKKVFTLW